MNIDELIEENKQSFEKDLQQATNMGAASINDVYLKYYSKTSGATIALVQNLAILPLEDKKEYGPKLNALKEEQLRLIEEAKEQAGDMEINNAGVDLTLPLPAQDSGYLHPTTQVIRELNSFFRYLGFSVYEGPEIETAEYNFRKLNLPEDHPATDQQESLFIMQPDILLRTHTSSVEARALTNLKPPIRLVVPGKCYRNETLSKTNSSFFYQYQGVVVDKGITLKHLKATLEQAHKFLFGEDTVLRFRYKYYPEVSPGMGVDMKCKFCDGAGCEVCKGRGWLEMLGSGMIHYNTLKMCGIDPEEYTGFAFGMGLDRQVMQKFAVSDIRKLYGGGVVYT